MPKNLNEGTHYIIRIRERLDGGWNEWFDGMTMQMDADGTELRGFLPDQSALLGMINRVQRLGLHLVAINEAPSPAEESVDGPTGDIPEHPGGELDT